MSRCVRARPGLALVYADVDGVTAWKPDSRTEAERLTDDWAAFAHGAHGRRSPFASPKRPENGIRTGSRVRKPRKKPSRGFQSEVRLLASTTQ